MEEQILSIMLSKDDWDQDKSSTAKEITSHVMEFIEWYTGHNSNIKEDYQYWLTNIKTK